MGVFGYALYQGYGGLSIGGLGQMITRLKIHGHNYPNHFTPFLSIMTIKTISKIYVDNFVDKSVENYAKSVDNLLSF